MGYLELTMYAIALMGKLLFYIPPNLYVPLLNLLSWIITYTLLFVFSMT